MRKYLALTLAFIVGLSMSASAVVLDPYKVIVKEDSEGNIVSTDTVGPDSDIYQSMEDGTYDGDWIEDEHVEKVDTTDYTSGGEYIELTEDIFDGKDAPHWGNTSAAVSILEEMEEKNIAVEDIADCCILLLGYRGYKYNSTDMLNKVQEFFSNNDINSLDHMRLMVSFKILQGKGESELSFVDNEWSDYESDWNEQKDVDLKSTARYHYLRGFYYNRQLDNVAEWQNNMEKCLKSENLSDIPRHVIDEVIDPQYKFNVTKDMIRNYCKNIGSDNMTDAAITHLMKAFKNLNWEMDNIQDEITFCNEILISVQPTDRTVPFLSLVKNKKNMLEDVQ